MPLKMQKIADGVYSNFDDVLNWTDDQLENLESVNDGSWEISNDVPYFKYLDKTVQPGKQNRDQQIESIATYIEENNPIENVLGTNKTKPGQAIKKIDEFFEEVVEIAQTRWTPIVSGLMAGGDDMADETADKRYVGKGYKGWHLVKE